MCRSMVDIQSPTAEIRRGKKKEEEEEEERRNRMNIYKDYLFHRATINNHFSAITHVSACQPAALVRNMVVKLVVKPVVQPVLSCK